MRIGAGFVTDKIPEKSFFRSSASERQQDCPVEFGLRWDVTSRRPDFSLHARPPLQFGQALSSMKFPSTLPQWHPAGQGTIVMTPSTDSPFGSLTSARAADLLHVIDLEARWHNLPTGVSKTEAGSGLRNLQGKQKAYEAFRSKLIAYRSRFGSPYDPEPLLSNPVRLAAWCRAILDLCSRAESDSRVLCPVHVVEKAYRIADRVGARSHTAAERPGLPPTTIRQAIEELDSIARWCDSLQSAGPVVPQEAKVWRVA